MLRPSFWPMMPTMHIITSRMIEPRSSARAASPKVMPKPSVAPEQELRQRRDLAEALDGDAEPGLLGLRGDTGEGEIVGVSHRVPPEDKILGGHASEERGSAAMCEVPQLPGGSSGMHIVTCVGDAALSSGAKRRHRRSGSRLPVPVARQMVHPSQARLRPVGRRTGRGWLRRHGGRRCRARGVGRACGPRHDASGVGGQAHVEPGAAVGDCCRPVLDCPRIGVLEQGIVRVRVQIDPDICGRTPAAAGRAPVRAEGRRTGRADRPRRWVG